MVTGFLVRVKKKNAQCDNNVPASAIKEEKKRGRPRKSYTVVLPKEKGNGQVGRPKGSKNNPKAKTNDDNYQDIVVEPLNIASVTKPPKEQKKRGPTMLSF
jgi:hypothetical protein